MGKLHTGCIKYTVEAGVVHDPPVLAPLLGRIQRCVGIAYPITDVVGMIRSQRNSDACPGAYPM
jgi:hypothetical protein